MPGVIHLRTPLLINTNTTPKAYIRSLTKPARKNHKAAMKANDRLMFLPIRYDANLVRRFMGMWALQIRGRWAFHPTYFDRLSAQGNLHLFAAFDDILGEIALLPMEQFGDFMYAQPVMYNKQTHPRVAKFMWFKMLEWACAKQSVNWVDLGGGFHGSWRDFLNNRNDPKFAYKWQFVPKTVKERPDEQNPYYAQRCTCGYKHLVTQMQTCPGCGSNRTSRR